MPLKKCLETMYSKFDVITLTRGRDIGTESPYVFCYFFFFTPLTRENRLIFAVAKTIESVDESLLNFHTLNRMPSTINIQSFNENHQPSAKLQALKVRMSFSRMPYAFSYAF